MEKSETTTIQIDDGRSEEADNTDDGPLSWDELKQLLHKQGFEDDDYQSGKARSQSRLRLHGQPESAVKVYVFRDHHGWCAYCQKIWLWMEEMKVPFRIVKVCLHSYCKEQEQWYKKINPNNYVPSAVVGETLYTQSEDIMIALENEYGKLGGQSLADKEFKKVKDLEASLLSAWWGWLAYESESQKEENEIKASYTKALKDIEKQLSVHPGPWLQKDFGLSDVFLVPFLERQYATVFYWKAYDIRKEHPKLGQFIDAMQTRPVYRAVMMDFHTPVNYIPAQIGFAPEDAFAYGTTENENSKRIDNGPHIDIPQECGGYPEPQFSRQEAVFRCVKHHENCLDNTHLGKAFGAAAMDNGMRCAFTFLLTGQPCKPTVEDAALACIYVRDRIMVPRDMTIWAAKRIRWAFTETAKLQGYDESRVKTIIVEKRLDQFPGPFSGDTQVLPDGMKEIKKFKEGATPELRKGPKKEAKPEKKSVAKTATKTKKKG